MDDEFWKHSIFFKNRYRLIKYDMSTAFFQAISHQAERAGLLSNKHFTVDGGPLTEAWAPMKSSRSNDEDRKNPPGGGCNSEVDFKGQKWNGEILQLTTDPDSRLFKKGKGRESKLCFRGRAPMENRNRLAIEK
jgi:hypothetical protein